MNFQMFLTLGTVLMGIVMLPGAGKKHIPIWKVAILAVILTAAGVLGAVLMARLESGEWGGRSFFGALFLAPFLMVPAALIFREPPFAVLDLCAPAECVMLALLKVNCYMDGCCYGKVIRIGSDGEVIRYPSQIVECAAAVLLMILLLIVGRKRKESGYLYPLYMILYGASRFYLNLKRETEPWIAGMAAGNFWSLISASLGIIIFFSVYTMNRKRNSCPVPEKRMKGE